ncbi:ALP1-like protein [Tanacetum coccineum]
MSSRLFLRIVIDIESHSKYFQQTQDARGKLGFSALQKCTSAIRQLALGSIPDAQDEYLQMLKRVSRDSLNKFCRWVIKLYGREYLRRPTRSDIYRLYKAHEELHGFLRMLGSIDCTYWPWANCPTRWRGQFIRGDHSHPTIMLEAVTLQDLWIWHAFFRVFGANNDLNVLHQSPLLNDIKDGIAPECPFEVNNNVYAFGYYLDDGIYSEEATFVKAYKNPGSNDVKQQRFKKHKKQQERT